MNSLTRIAAALAVSICWIGGPAIAAVSADEAAKLKSDLTPLGAEKAGNKDGSIPAWTGGYTKVPPGYKSGQPRPDPFADEKPLFTITAANMAQYSDKLDEGQQHLLKKFPDYKLHVYRTHRTAAAPQWVYDETFKNATRARLDGDAVAGAYGGIPFPIAKSGAEMIWNHSLRVRPPAYKQAFRTYTVDTKGTASIASGAINEVSVPYYTKGLSPEEIAKDGGAYYKNLQSTLEPSIRAGEMLLYYDQFDNTRPAWQYLVGQRRVRRAPTICCDTPNFVASGVDFFDQVFVWFGPSTNYDWKIVGKREMLIPYNANRLVATKSGEAMAKNFVNPEFVRWELHRVWEVEGTVRAGKRDVRPKRKLYLDEDTYIAAIGNTWDSQGTLWHTSYGFPFVEYELPAVGQETYTTLDLIKGTYSYTTVGDLSAQIEMLEPWPASYYTPDSLSRKGVR
ncbi:DUF1329 domain-containing protein [Methylibium sp.]|uniref:DUF1329 domain-containing protein n=1 Tax=Methylibium sp. TaxID=2067992 RepID=UPI00333F32D4